MRVLQFLATGLYIGYLVQVGLLLIYLPWSSMWGLIMARLPPGAAWLLDAPAVRGGLTAFGVLHLTLVFVEVVAAGAHDRGNRRAGPPSTRRERGSQDTPSS